jgi:hypothetical protein
MPDDYSLFVLLLPITERCLGRFSSDLISFSRISFAIAPERPIRSPDLNLRQPFLSLSTLLRLKQILEQLP